MKVEKIFTLSSYEPRRYGIGHNVDGRLPENPSFAENFNGVHSMVEEFGDYPTGTKIRVTMEVISEI